MSIKRIKTILSTNSASGYTQKTIVKMWIYPNQLNMQNAKVKRTHFFFNSISDKNLWYVHLIDSFIIWNQSSEIICLVNKKVLFFCPLSRITLFVSNIWSISLFIEIIEVIYDTFFLFFFFILNMSILTWCMLRLLQQNRNALNIFEIKIRICYFQFQFIDYFNICWIFN